MARIRFRSAALPAAVILLGLTGCANLQGAPGKAASAKPVPPDMVGIHINDGDSMFPVQTGDAARQAIPSLKAMSRMHRNGSGASKEAAKEMVELPVIRDTALRYGAEGGVAWATRIIDGELRANAARLSQIYDFSRLVTYQPGGVQILPPVISESQNLYQSSDFGRTIRVADTYYDIVRQARFVPSAPLWYGYLYRTWQAPHRPFEAGLPHNSEEEAVWKHYVKAGWRAGVKEGETIFRLDLDRLNRDFTGMIRYRKLYDEGKVSAPVVQAKTLGITGTGQNMREGDRVVKIIAEPSLSVPHPEASPIKATPN